MMKGPTKRRGGRWLYLPLHLGLLALSVVGLAAPWMPVSILPEAQIVAPMIPVLGVFHLLFWLWMRRRARGLALLNLLMLLACGYVVARDLNWPKGQEGDPDLSLVSYNVATFDYNPDNIEKVARLLSTLQPDVVALQEFRNQKLANGRRALDYLAEKMDMPHARFIHLPIHIHGTATFSRFPIIRVDTLFLPQKEINSGILLTLEGPRGPIGVGNVHLTSFNLARIWKKDSTWQGRAWAFRENAVDVLRLQQEKVDLVMEKTARYPHPLILCGDLNATPHSRITRPFFQRFEDSFAQGGKGLGWSFPILGPLGIRIDYQFFSQGLAVQSHQVVRSGNSDHYPLLVRYQQVSSP